MNNLEPDMYGLGYSDGYEIGFQEGHHNGYQVGLMEGYADAELKVENRVKKLYSEILELNARITVLEKNDFREGA